MRILARYALSIGAAALLAGCGGSQPPIAISGALPESRATAASHSHHDLLYVSNLGTGTVTFYHLRSTKRAGTLSGFGTPVTLCSDRDGDVFVVDSTASTITEYAHGATSPIKTPLSDPYGSPFACAVDNSTGNLAVTDSTAGVLIYSNGSGTPAQYTNSAFAFYSYAAYDTHGDLFIDGDSHSGPVFAELPKGSSTLESIKVDTELSFPTGIAWDGEYFAVCDEGHRPNVIDEFSLSGSTGTLVGTTTLYGSETITQIAVQRFSAQRRIIITPDADDYHHPVAYWLYPAGGTPIKRIRGGISDPYGVTVSVAPSR